MINKTKNGGWVLFLLVAFLFLGAGAASSAWATTEAAQTPHASWSFIETGLIPVQSGGRLKPLDSYARETVLYVTGSHSFEGWNCVDLLFSWITFPQSWDGRELISIGRADVKRQLGLDEKRSRFSPHELIMNFALAQYAQDMAHTQTVPAPTGAMTKQDPREQELRRVLDRIGLYRSIVSGEGWPIIPQPAPKAWLSVASEGTPEGTVGASVRDAFVELVKAYQAGNQALFARNATFARAAVEGEIPGFSESDKRVIEVESLYNRAHPFLAAWILYLAAALAWSFQLARPKKSAESRRSGKLARLAGTLMIAAVSAHVLGIAFRCYVAGRPPVTNMYESVIWVSFGVVAFATVIFFTSKRQSVVLAVACALATLGLIAGDAAPAILDPGIRPLVPVLRSNYWLTIHVLTITLGYAAFALSLGIADVALFRFIQGEKQQRQQILALNQLNYRAMQFGVVLIAAGTILGGVWADYSWGRFWGWDPKEVWALIVLLSYLVILHGRFAGWVGQFGFPACSVVAFLSVLMAWYGVNFILGVGLHSYGFSTGGFTGVMSFVGIQFAYLGYAVFRHRQSLKL